MTIDKKSLLALMAATIYGQSKTLRVPECVSIAEEIWGEMNGKYPEGEEYSKRKHEFKPSGDRFYCDQCGYPQQDMIHEV
jgi:predicted RNA-binding Zn-ribbon protein involved in translation (DUF1610 family)